MWFQMLSGSPAPMIRVGGWEMPLCGLRLFVVPAPRFLYMSDHGG